MCALRAVPGLQVLRPADATETVTAWKAALSHLKGPTAIVLTRQGLPILPPLPTSCTIWRELFATANPNLVIVATGSKSAQA